MTIQQTEKAPPLRLHGDSGEIGSIPIGSVRRTFRGEDATVLEVDSERYAVKLRIRETESWHHPQIIDCELRMDPAEDLRTFRFMLNDTTLVGEGKLSEWAAMEEAYNLAWEKWLSDENLSPDASILSEWEGGEITAQVDGVAVYVPVPHWEHIAESTTWEHRYIPVGQDIYLVDRETGQLYKLHSYGPHNDAVMLQDPVTERVCRSCGWSKLPPAVYDELPIFFKKRLP